MQSVQHSSEANKEVVIVAWGTSKLGQRVVWHLRRNGAEIRTLVRRGGFGETAFAFRASHSSCFGWGASVSSGY